MKEKIISIKNKKWLELLFWVVWPIFVFYAIQYILAAILGLLFKDDLQNFADSSVFTAVYSAVVYLIIFAGIYFIPKYLFKQKISKKDTGISGLPTWTDIGLGFAGLIIAMILSGIITAIATSIFPNFNANETQDVGFSNLSQNYQYLTAFFALVVIAPIAEELVFRGVIYSKMREVSPWLAIILVSLMFGAAHGQWNVGITTFTMSVIMCLIREKLTDTIWAGIILHMLKNAIAFYFLFMAPEILQTITQ